MMYAPQDDRVTGVVLMNPWVRSDAGLARVTVRNYYSRRIFSAELWRKVVRGEFKWRESLASLSGTLRKVLGGNRGGEASDRSQPFQVRMLSGIERFQGRTLVITSGDDLTAAEFLQLVASSKAWQKVLAGARVRNESLPAANHTFSSADWRGQVNHMVGDWLKSW